MPDLQRFDDTPPDARAEATLEALPFAGSQPSELVEHLLESWALFPELPTHSEFAAAAHVLPFRDLRPLPPDPGVLPERWRREALAARAAGGFGRWWPGWAEWMARREAQALWRSRAPSLQRARAEALNRRQQLLATDREQWLQGEERRVQRLQQLLERDAQAVFAEAADVASGLRLPFATRVDLHQDDDPALLFLTLELPDPAAILGSHSQGAYAGLVSGCALHAAALLFSRIPYLEHVCVAGWRCRPGALVTGATRPPFGESRQFLLEAVCERAELAQGLPVNQSADRWVRSLGGQVEAEPSGDLLPVETPVWCQRGGV